MKVDVENMSFLQQKRGSYFDNWSCKLFHMGRDVAGHFLLFSFSGLFLFRYFFNPSPFRKPSLAFLVLRQP